MKRIFIGTALAVMAMFSACESLEIQEPETQDEAVLFTATIGADTKTYLEWDGEVYKTVWDEDDYIWVYDAETGRSEQCGIVKGAGTTTAVFAGTLEADRYVAIYGYAGKYEDEYTVWLSNWQYMNWHYSWDEDTQTETMQGRWSDACFPMVAQSDDKTFSFQNLCSVLKVTLTGSSDRHVDYIRVISNDEQAPMNGTAFIDMSGKTPVMAFDMENLWEESYQVECGVWSNLYHSPLEVFIALPAQTYKGGFTVEVQTDYGIEEFVVSQDIEMRRSRIRNLNISLSDHDESVWGIVGSSPELGEWTYDLPMVYNGRYWELCNLYLEAGWEFKARANGSWDENYGGYGSYIYKNEATPLSWFGDNFIIDESGYYDIYLDVRNEYIYLMSPGLYPGDSPEETWGVCGDMTEWGNYSDIQMIYEDGYYVVRDLYLEANQNFVLRTNNSWEGKRFGLSSDMSGYYQFNGVPTNTNIPVIDGLYEYYENFKVMHSGNYDIYLDVSEQVVFIMNSGVALTDIPTTEYVIGYNYDNLYYNVPDETLVKVEGLVMSKTNLGFIIALDNYTQNAIYVYDRDNSLEHVEIGNYLDIYAVKTTYRGVAELVYASDNNSWHYIIDDTIGQYYESYTDITSEFASYSNWWYQYIRYVGTLQQNSQYYNVVVEGSDQVGSIVSPVQDLTEYLGRKVCVEGYYAGQSVSGGVTYMNVVLTRIAAVDDIPEGSTGDVLPGDDIIVSRPLRTMSNR